MNVVIFAGELSATLTARILPLAGFLEDQAVECKVIRPIAWHSITNGKVGNVLSIALTHPVNEYLETLTSKPDVVIIGRVSTPQIFLLQKILKGKGVKTVFDLDDALFLSSGNLFGINVRPGSFFLEKVAKNSDFVTVNGHYLLKYAQKFNQNAIIIPDPIDVNLFVPTSKRVSNKITIGWHGNAKVHYENLRILLKPLEKLAYDYDIRFKLISYLGDMNVKQMFRRLENVMDIDYGLNHWVPIRQYYRLLSDFDIMAAPLQKTAWYEGKSALRVGIGMAMGIPVVASPVGEQKHVIKHGVNGFLAKNEDEWYTYLKKLIEDKKLRDSVGKSGRETVEKTMSSRICGKKLFSIINGISQ